MSKKYAEYLTISEFAKLSRAGAKALRYYDEAGIFKPAFVDPDTGYRYYSINQIYQLNLVRLCIEEDISLDELRNSYDENDILGAGRFFQHCSDRARARWHRDYATMLRMDSYTREYTEQITAELLSERVRTIPAATLLTAKVCDDVAELSYDRYLDKLTTCIREAQSNNLIYLAKQGAVHLEDGWYSFIELHADGLAAVSYRSATGVSIHKMDNMTCKVTSALGADIERCFATACEGKDGVIPDLIQEAWAYSTVVGVFAFNSQYIVR